MLEGNESRHNCIRTVPGTKAPILCPTGSNVLNPPQHLHETGSHLN